MNEMILRTLLKQFHSGLLSGTVADGLELNWNSIDYTDRKWLEIGPEYFETADSRSYNGNAVHFLSLGASISDLEEEYGENNFPAGAIKDGRLVVFDAYDDPESKIFGYLCERYNIKAEEEVRELLATPVEDLRFSFPNSGNEYTKILKAEGFSTLGDIISKSPEELVSENRFSEKMVSSIVSSVRQAGIDYGKEFSEKALEKNKQKYLDFYRKVSADGIIDPLEKAQLESLRLELGLSREATDNVLANYYAQNTETVRPSEAVYIGPDAAGAKAFMDYYNAEKFSVCRDFRKPDGMLPALPDMTEESATAVLDSLDVDELAVYGDFARGKFWLCGNDISYNPGASMREASAADIISRAKDVVSHWNRDDSTVTENRYAELIDGFYPDEILVPVDLRYRVCIPQGIADTFGDKAKDKVDSAIRSVFVEPSELVCDNSAEAMTPGTVSYDLTYRHQIVVSPETDYRNLNFHEIEERIQFIVGTALNDEFGIDLSDISSHKAGKIITFEEISAGIPERFTLTRNGIEKTVLVNRQTIEKYGKTVDSLALTMENILEGSEKVADEFADFLADKQDFLQVLKENPLLKKFVGEEWDKLRDNGRNFARQDWEMKYSPASAGQVMSFVNRAGNLITRPMCENLLETFAREGTPVVIDELGNIYRKEENPDRRTGDEGPDLVEYEPSGLIEDYKEILEKKGNDHVLVSLLDDIQDSLVAYEERSFENDLEASRSAGGGSQESGFDQTWASVEMLSAKNGEKLSDDLIDEIAARYDENGLSLRTVNGEVRAFDNESEEQYSGPVSLRDVINQVIEWDEREISALHGGVDDKDIGNINSYIKELEAVSEKIRGREQAVSQAAPTRSDGSPLTLLCLDAKDLTPFEKAAYIKELVRFHDLAAQGTEAGTDIKLSVRKVFYKRHDSVSKALKDKHEVAVVCCETGQGEKGKTSYMTFDVMRNKENEIVSCSPFSGNLDSERKAVIDVCKVFEPAIFRHPVVTDVDCVMQLVKDGLSIRGDNNLNLTYQLLDIDGFHEERESIEKNVLNSFLGKVKEACGGDTSIGNIFLQASRQMNSCTSAEKEIIGSALSKFGLDSKEKLESFLRKQMNPPERTRTRRREPEIGRGL